MFLMLGDFFYVDDNGDERPGKTYCFQALADATLYQLVSIGHYTEDQINDPTKVSAEFAGRLLRANSAHKRAQAEADRRNAPKTAH